jgi:hypothetical protein
VEDGGERSFERGSEGVSVEGTLLVDCECVAGLGVDRDKAVKVELGKGAGKDT